MKYIDKQDEGRRNEFNYLKFKYTLCKKINVCGIME